MAELVSSTQKPGIAESEEVRRRRNELRRRSGLNDEEQIYSSLPTSSSKSFLDFEKMNDPTKMFLKRGDFLNEVHAEEFIHCSTIEYNFPKLACVHHSRQVNYSILHTTC